MSFGFGVGHFITVAELAERLYKDIIKVARQAPEDVKKLSKDLMVVKACIDMLCDQMQDPGSTLHSPDQSRKQAVTNMMTTTKEILVKVEKLAKKHGILNTATQNRSRI